MSEVAQTSGSGLKGGQNSKMGKEETTGLTLGSQISISHLFPQMALFSIYSPASRTFRASTANFFFPLVLLVGLAISAVPVLYSIFL